MNFIIPLTKGAMHQHAIAFIKNFSDNTFILGDSIIFNENQFGKLNRIVIDKKGIGLRKILWGLSIFTSFRIFHSLNRSERNIIIVNGEFLPWITFLIVIARIRKFNVILCWHDVTPHSGKYSNYLMWSLSLVNATLANKVVVHSHRYLIKLQKYSLFKKKVNFIPLPPYGFANEVNRQLCCAPPIDDFWKSSGYILFVGRVEYYKGVHDIISVFSKNNSLRLIIAGKGSAKYVTGIKNKISNLDNILFIEKYLSEDELLYLIEYSAAVIMPYLHASQSILPYIAACKLKPVIFRRGIGFDDTANELRSTMYGDNFELNEILNNKKFNTPTYSLSTHVKSFVNEFYKLLL